MAQAAGSAGVMKRLREEGVCVRLTYVVNNMQKIGPRARAMYVLPSFVRKGPESNVDSSIVGDENLQN